MEPDSGYFSSRRLRLHYVDWGSPERPPLILVHGGRDHCRSWDWVARALREDFHVLALDLAGHGDSEHVRGGCYALTDFIYDLSQFLSEKGFVQAALIGHSMGGGVCSLFAGAFPEMVRRLVLIEGLRPAMLAPEPAHVRLRNWVEQTRDLSERQPKIYRSESEAMTRMKDAHPSLSDEQVAHLTRHGLRRTADGGLVWKFDNFIRLRAPSRLPPQEVEALWGRIECPALMIGGSASGRPDPAKNGWLSMFRNGRSEMIAGAGHWVHHDDLDAVVGLIRPFLREAAS